MKPDPESTCPYTGHKDKCAQHFMNCPKWIQVQGAHPQTGEQINDWRCADAWLPMLMIENSQQQRSTGAAVESFRNEFATVFQALVAQIPDKSKSKPKLVEATGED